VTVTASSSSCPRREGVDHHDRVDKQKILQVLRDRGLYARAEWVDRQLPARVDLEKNAGLLATLHISSADLTDPPSRPGLGDAEA
jgi:hypothetical protein